MRKPSSKRLVLLAASLGACIPMPAYAQGAPGGGHGGGRHGGGRHGANAPAAVNPDAPRLVPPPAQRLDPGALLCRTEDALQQHQAAVEARLDGRDASEPGGCHPVAAVTPVAVLERHGTSRTAVRLPGPPEQVGWTDAVVRDAPPPAPPRVR